VITQSRNNAVAADVMLRPHLLAMTSKPILATFLVVAAFAQGGCSKQHPDIHGTDIANDDTNRQILDTVESYRVAVEKHDVKSLMLMASKSYWEDRGTVESADDYGYDGLMKVLSGRFQLASDIRYAMRYDRIRRVCPHGGDLEKGCRAHVDVQIDASYTVNDASGEAIRKDKRDQNELVLEWDGSRWLFVSGM